MLTDFETAAILDQNDHLRKYRGYFKIPETNGNEQTYFLGNSLGLQPQNTGEHINRILSSWASLGVEAFFEGSEPWMDFHENLTALLTDIIGAKSTEISIMNQLTINLHLMMVSFYNPSGKRKKILCEQHAFPSDQYMISSHVAALGMNPDDIIIEISPRNGEFVIDESDILNAIHQHHEELALVLLPGVQYYTGQIFNIQQITEQAHQYGITCGFDLAHAVGNIPLSLHDWDVDFACWCSYKYLNGGPGAIAGAFIHEKYVTGNIRRFAGWWGNEKKSRFEMNKNFKPELNASGWQLSTPSPLLFACLQASLEIFQEAGWNLIQEKQKKMLAFHWKILHQIKQEFSEDLIQIITPVNESGSQISLYFKENGKKIHEGLKSEGFITDWREPNVIRLAPVPLYNTYCEVFNFYETLCSMIRSV